MRKFWRSFGHAWRGLQVTARNEPNFRTELVLGLLAVGLAVVARVPVWPVVVVSTIVLVVEAINSAIERIVDYISPDIHPAARDIKDISAGAVLVASLGALVFALVYLLPPLLARFGVH